MCKSGSHKLVTWEKANPSDVNVFPFRCRSWRHVGTCQQFRGSQDFVRVRDAIVSRGDRWVYLVLTFNQRAELDEWTVYRAGLSRWQKLNQRLSRRFGAVEYIQTWEKHVRSGFPHVNAVVHNDLIWGRCRGDGWRSWRQELRDHAIACGFGKVLHVEPLRRGGSLTLAGYLTKLSRELTGASVKNQVPVNAPAHFRRIRASRGLLAPIYRPGIHTGALVSSRTVDLFGPAAISGVQAGSPVLGQKRKKQEVAYETSSTGRSGT